MEGEEENFHGDTQKGAKSHIHQLFPFVVAVTVALTKDYITHPRKWQARVRREKHGMRP